ncbi:AAA domain-containing protein [Campylobacter devanensis]|uniref:AAA domain-containing protein n=1 Tax=Campylobacter devanensis TaxID=3161138 RepID=UPI000A351DC0|nr:MULTISPECIES: AAA domain-containing protein [unclassified Campylobacter]
MAFYKHRTRGKISDISVITPFVDVVNMSKNSNIELKTNTIHTMQGRESKVVVLVLGGTSTGARSWAAKRPNLLNVALTRARQNFFVIGDFKA